MWFFSFSVSFFLLYNGAVDTNDWCGNGCHLVGQTDNLNVRVRMWCWSDICNVRLHIYQVMWVRRTVDKFSLLSVGNITHTGDPRIKVTFQYPNNWRLHINPMQKEDAGLYHCQVSTHPPRVFTTNVTVMREYKSFNVLVV